MLKNFRRYFELAFTTLNGGDFAMSATLNDFNTTSI